MSVKAMVVALAVIASLRLEKGKRVTQSVDLDHRREAARKRPILLLLFVRNRSILINHLHLLERAGGALLLERLLIRQILHI
jgi:hypothetical protein